MRKSAKIVIVMSIAIALIVIAVAGYFIVSEEKYERDSIALNIPIDVNSAALSDYYEAVLLLLPKYCEGRDLIKIQTDISEAGFTKIVFTFYKYVNGLREGGNVQYADIHIEPQAQMITKADTFSGAGRAASISSDIPLTDDVLRLSAKDITAMAVEAKTQLPSELAHASDISAWLWQLEEGMGSYYELHLTDENNGNASPWSSYGSLDAWQMKESGYTEHDLEELLVSLHEKFVLHSPDVSGLMGYNWYMDGLFFADLNSDGIYELYIGASTGSGIIHSFIHVYDPSNDSYYILSARGEYEYCFVAYDNELFVFQSRSMYPMAASDSSENKVEETDFPRYYQPVLDNETFTLNEIDYELEIKLQAHDEAFQD